MQEELGYIEGGSETLVACARAGDRSAGRRDPPPRRSRASEIRTTADGRVTASTAGGDFHPADAVIRTMPTPLL